MIDGRKVSDYLNELLSNYDYVKGVDIYTEEDGVRIIIETESRNDVYRLGKEYLEDQ